MKNVATKDIAGYEGKYSVSADGRVYSLNYQRTGQVRELKPLRNICGYLTYRLCRNSKAKCFLAHRLVAFAFIGEPKGKKEINHKDGNKENNNVENLEWVTHTQNMRHAIENGLHDTSKLVALRKIPAQVEEEIIEMIHNFSSDKEIAEEFGYRPATIKRIRQRVEG